MLDRSKPLTRILLIDENEDFALKFIRSASAQGVSVEWFDDLAEIGNPAQATSYHAMVASMPMDPVTGFDIAEYADTYLPELPLILIADDEASEAHAVRWPESVQAIIPRAKGPEAILKSALNLAAVAEIDLPAQLPDHKVRQRSHRLLHS